MEVFLWIAVAVLLYTYIGYGVFLFVYSLFAKPKNKLIGQQQPAVTFIVPAYNEGKIISDKIKNTMALAYPANKLYFLFVTDGCTDDTNEIISRHAQITLLHQPKREGKAMAINRAMQTVQTPIVIFSDANVMLHPNSIKNLVRHYADTEVGGVSGEKRIVNNKSSGISFGERLYWKYESLLKKTSAAFYTLVGAAGELFSIRTELYQPLPANIILDDFVISATVCRQGYRFVYDEEAYGTEISSATLQDESKRKTRISAGCFQALFLFTALLNPFKNRKVAFQYFSHRVLRWTVCPLLLPLVFIANALLLRQEYPLYKIFFFAQCFFYLVVLAGWALSKTKLAASVFFIPYYFVFMIASQWRGFFRYVSGRQTVLWEKAERHHLAEAS